MCVCRIVLDAGSPALENGDVRSKFTKMALLEEPQTASFGSIFKRISLCFGRLIRRTSFKNLLAFFQIPSKLRALHCIYRSELEGRAYLHEVTGPLRSTIGILT